jgi:hypothetical protein
MFTLVDKDEHKLTGAYYPESEIEKHEGKIPAKAHHPALNANEHYAGIIIGKNGEADYHLILMEGEVVDVNWQEAIDWIAIRNDGASLPTRREQSLLYANLKEAFEPTWYWSSEQHASNSDYAWYQEFSNGGQYCYGKSYEMRARAVRRVLIIQ